MKHAVSLIALVAAFPAFAQNTRALDAHEHGVGTLNIAIDGTTVAMAFEAPGADIVGFEYEAKSDADLAAIDAAVVTLGAPLELFVMPEAAACSVVAALAALETEDDHEDHDEEGHDDHDDHDDHDEHADEAHEDHDAKDHDDHGEEGHDDHAEEGHDDHGDEDHAEEGHDDHGDEDHDDHADKDHDDHDHDDHAEDADEGGHTEFHADYTLNCDNPDAVTEITFAYFDAFPNALEVEVQIITASGAQAFEVERDAPVLNLGR